MPFSEWSRLEATLAGSDFAGLTVEEVIRTKLRFLNPACSNFGAWGSRTLRGDLFSGRNLDWSTDTGMNTCKLATVIHPPASEGKAAHVMLGYCGIMGALTGMSATGLTVHEANLESNRDSFHGFPWLYRLRAVMEQSADLASAKKLWDATNNTCGFNHAVGSNNEASGAPK